MIDGSMASTGGGFTYLVNLMPELARLAPADRFRVFVADRRLADAIPEAENVHVAFLGQLGWRQRLRFTYFQAPRRAAQWKASLYFSVAEMAPLRAPCPRIASFRNPNVFTLGKGQGFHVKQRIRLRVLRGLARLSAARCERIMFASQDSARWMGDSIGLAERKRVAIHHGVDAESWRSSAERVERERPYVLSVSSVYSYKNYVRLIEAYAELAERRPGLPELLIVGDDQHPSYSRRMEAARRASGGLAESIQILGEVPYHEIRRYYRGAELFVFPSYLETFGHPLLEAMASEIPLVVSDIPVFREIAAQAALYADPFAPSALAAAMESALYEPGVREQLVERARERLGRFTWRRSAERHLALFEAVLEENGTEATA
jgi:glycosyltransferase involved in cell wall biosynthesis